MIATDEIDLTHQTQPWGEPVELLLREEGRKENFISVAVMLYDAKGVPCLDSRNVVRSSLADEEKLLDNLGTARCSSELQLYNGRAEISVAHKGECSIGATSKGPPAAFLDLS